MGTTGKHPECCKDPENCNLTYVQHLQGIRIAAAATPTQTDAMETVRTNIREKRLTRDRDAYKRLRNDGYQPRSIFGSRLRERQGNTPYDIEHRPVKIDWNDPT